MPTPIPPGLRLGLIEPKDAAAAFTRRNLLLPSFRWQDVWQEEHARAFAVAGVMRLDILKIFREEVDAALNGGAGIAAFQKSLQARLVAKGFWGDVEITDQVTGEVRKTRFDERRLQLIYDVNLRQSHAAGRWARIQATKKRFPFIVYRTMRDERVRKSHAAWEGVALPVDHEFWATHFPPNGWRCRCTAHAMDEEGLRRLSATGVKIKREAPDVQWTIWHDRHSGRSQSLPVGIDPGFAYNPGRFRDAETFDALLAKAPKVAPREASVVLTQALAEAPQLARQKAAELGDWLRDVVRHAGDAAAPPMREQLVGVMHPWALDSLAAVRVELGSPLIVLHEEHALRALGSVTLASVRDLPVLLAQATGLVRDESSWPMRLLYLIPQPGRPGRKLAVHIEPGLGEVFIRDMQIMDVEQLAAMRLVWGSL